VLPLRQTGNSSHEILIHPGSENSGVFTVFQIPQNVIEHVALRPDFVRAYSIRDRLGCEVLPA
jgi:hypothetical protein